MGERSSYPPGTFSWVELGVADLAAAQAFYGGLFGWEAQETPSGEPASHRLCTLEGRPVAGLSQRDDSAPLPAHWLSYVTVASVDAVAGRVAELGGAVVRQPADIRDAGRMALVRDQAGAFLALWEARSHPGAARVNEPGCLTWNELATRDTGAAARFYESLLGWRANAVDGSDGYLVVENDGRVTGGIRPIGEGEPAELPAHWAVYFSVADADAAVARVQELGGRVLMGPMSLESGRYAAVADPQGATFSLFQGPADD